MSTLVQTGVPLPAGASGARLKARVVAAFRAAWRAYVRAQVARAERLVARVRNGEVVW